ncbi:MAG: hypothetical protein R3190_04175 [Thermoanaerobaculia bacterium]|nr:hypothetical protein [Thermoanaerobaculia bacterium]
MAVEVREVLTRRDLRRFVRFPLSLYRDHPCWVPPLLRDEVTTLRRDKNPAFAFCTARYWLAWRDGAPVGRVAAIRNQRYIETWQRKDLHFGWLDFVDDAEVSAALLATVETWGRELGLTAAMGPLGFTDLDREGMLVEGFDELGTFATLYNHPYYPGHLEALGYTKATDWVEYEIRLPDVYPERLARLAARAEARFGLRRLRVRRARDLRPYAREAFGILNETYRDFHAFVPLTPAQIDFYVDQFLPFVDPALVPVIVDRGDRVAAFMVAMPSLSRALQRSRGRLFPLGFLHLLRALRHSRRLDFYVGAVRPDLQAHGVHVVMMDELTRLCRERGIVAAETNVELETNAAVQAVWKTYDARQHKRRRCFRKPLATAEGSAAGGQGLTST